MTQLPYEIVQWQKDPNILRYFIICSNTGEILNDANGHGFSSVHSANKALLYQIKFGTIQIKTA